MKIGERDYYFISLLLGGTINADTKRAAVGKYVKDAETRGVDVPWSILPNRNARWNKLTFRADGEPTAGWYCYLRANATGRGQL
jgi:hypothetical protein